jgi:hypothetical protein
MINFLMTFINENVKQQTNILQTKQFYCLPGCRYVLFERMFCFGVFIYFFPKDGVL